jgi:mannose-6-phosphate isomerase-like protein (cupin superfamily)
MKGRRLQKVKENEMDRMTTEILKDVALDEIAPKRCDRRSPVDHWSPAVLLERAAYLRKMAKLGDGSASEVLKEYPQHSAMLSFRSRSGEAEIHEEFADLFVVLAGTATLITGGAVNRARTVAPGETRGTSIHGGTQQRLRAGEIAHVPAGVPHQMLLAGENTIACVVMKVREFR